MSIINKCHKRHWITLSNVAKHETSNYVHTGKTHIPPCTFFRDNATMSGESSNDCASGYEYTLIIIFIFYFILLTWHTTNTHFSVWTFVGAASSWFPKYVKNTARSWSSRTSIRMEDAPSTFCFRIKILKTIHTQSFGIIDRDIMLAYTPSHVNSKIVLVTAL